MNFSNNIYLIQSTTDVFSPILKATLVVFNAEGYRIAASEHFKAKINDWGPENYPALIAMRQKKRIEILHPRSDEICKSCIYTSVCGKNAVLHIPLMEDENLLGCLSILWYQKVNLENFEGHIQYLIGLFTMLLNNE